jgi:hypothetical protein
VIGQCDAVGLTVEQSGKDQPSSRAKRGRNRGREVDQRPGKDIRDDQVIGCARPQSKVRQSRRDCQLDLAA